VGGNPNFAAQRIKEAADRTAATRKILEEEAEQNKQAYERFYNNLALFSSGTLALSMTYLGYLKNTSKPVAHSALLIASWVALLVCLMLSLFRTLFYTHYRHFARLRQYTADLKRRKDALAEEVPNLNIVNITSIAEREEFVAELKDAAKTIEADSHWAQRRESFYSWTWIWAERAARIAFVSGLTLLVSFAIANR